MPDIVKIGEWTAYRDQSLLTSDTDSIRLEPKAMAVLSLLAARAPEVVTTDTILDEVWNGVFVGDGVVYRAIALLRKSLGDTAKNPTYIESIPRVGYRLKCSVEHTPVADRSASRESRPKLGLLGVQISWLSDEAQGVPPEVTLDIGRHVRWNCDAIRVHIAQQVLEGPDYRVIVSTSAEKTLSWQLLSDPASELIWSGDHDQPTQRNVLDRLAEMIAEGVVTHVKKHRLDRLRQEGEELESSSYWEHIFLSDSFRSTAPKDVAGREQRLLRAIQMFPERAPAHAAHADLLSWRVINRLSDDPKTMARLARDAASSAVDLDPDSPYVISRCGTVYARLGDYVRGLELCRRAYSLAPSAASKEALARVLCFAGEPEEAVELLRDVLTTMPAGQVFQYGKLVIPLVQMGVMEEALAFSTHSVVNFPKDYYAWVVHANVLMQVQKADEGLAAWQEASRLYPDLSAEVLINGTIRTYGRTEDQRTRLTAGLRQFLSE